VSLSDSVEQYTLSCSFAEICGVYPTGLGRSRHTLGPPEAATALRMRISAPLYFIEVRSGASKLGDRDEAFPRSCEIATSDCRVIRRWLFQTTEVFSCSRATTSTHVERSLLFWPGLERFMALKRYLGAGPLLERPPATQIPRAKPSVGRGLLLFRRMADNARLSGSGQCLPRALRAILSPHHNVRWTSAMPGDPTSVYW
jgi:hypothetical protein